MYRREEEAAGIGGCTMPGGDAAEGCRVLSYADSSGHGHLGAMGAEDSGDLCRQDEIFLGSYAPKKLGSIGEDAANELIAMVPICG